MCPRIRTIEYAPPKNTDKTIQTAFEIDIANVEQIHMISATKLSKGGVAILLIIVISQKKDKSGRIVRNPFIKIILRENFRR